VTLRLFAKLVVGWSMLLLGAAGIVLPIVPGIPFLLAGLVILSRRYAWAEKAIDFIRRRIPRPVAVWLPSWTSEKRSRNQKTGMVPLR
jgi:uncharacterized membrane protein YbaN (DUF454 family)